MTETAINGLSRPQSPLKHPISQLIIKLFNRTITPEISSSGHHRSNHLTSSPSSYHAPPPIRHLFLPSSSSPPLLPLSSSSSPANSTSLSVPSLSTHFHSPHHHHHFSSLNSTVITNLTELSSEAESSIAESINATSIESLGEIGGFRSWLNWWSSSIYTQPDILLAFALIVFYAIFVLFICAIILRIAVTIMCSSSGRTLAATFATSSEGFSETESSSQRTRGYSQSYSASYTNNGKNRRLFAHEMTSFALGDRTNSPSIIDEEDEES